MKSITFELSRKEEDGKRQILSRVCFSRDYRPRLKTGIFIHPEHFKNGKVIIPRNTCDEEKKKYLKRVKIQLELFIAHTLLLIKASDGSRLSKSVMETILQYDNNGWEVFTSIDRLKVEIDKLENHEKTIFEYLDDYARYKMVSTARVKVYNVLKRLIMRYNLFQKMAGAAELILEFPKDTSPENVYAFVSYMENEHTLSMQYPKTYRNIIKEVSSHIPTPKHQVFNRILAKSMNTIQGFINILSSLYHWLQEQGVIVREDLLSQVQRLEPVYLKAIYLSIEERNRVDRMSITRKGNMNVTKDIFIFQCLTGCRYGDLCKLTADNIIDGILSYRPEKTRIHANQVIPRVPLSPRALELVDKYSGQDPEGRLFPFAKHGTYNYDIKQILKRAGIDRTVYVYDRSTKTYKAVPLYEAASSHLARRTFVGTTYKLVKDPSIICSMSGHTDGSKSFCRYRHIDDEDKRDVINALE